MRQIIIILALIALWPGYVYAQINQDTINSDVPGGGGGSGGGLSSGDIDTLAELNAIITPDVLGTTSTQSMTNKTIDCNGNTCKPLRGTDCTTFDAATGGQYCVDTDDLIIYFCSVGEEDPCDDAEEWIAVSSASSLAGLDDVTLTTPQDDDVLVYDTGAWVNIAPLWLPLAGGTLTGQLVADNLGIEFEDSDTNPTCSAGNYNIYADLSETSLKACTNGSVSKIATFADLIDANIPNDITIDLATNATTADALSANPTDCSSNQFANAIAANGNLTCAALLDADVPDTITASNYLPLAGGTMTGQIISDNLGIEFEESDTNPTCSTNNYNIYADASETAVKVCNNGTAEQVVTPNNTVTFQNKNITSSANTLTVDWSDLENVPAFRKTLVQLRPQDNEPPPSSPATFFTRNGHPGLTFNGDVCAIWSFVMPNTYGGNGVTVDIWTVSSETSNDIDWDGSWERIATTQDIDSDSFATAISADNNNNNATSGIPTKVSIAFTDGAQMDSCASGELCRFRLCRDATSDTGGAAEGNAVLIGGQIKETP